LSLFCRSYGRHAAEYFHVVSPHNIYHDRDFGRRRNGGFYIFFPKGLVFAIYHDMHVLNQGHILLHSCIAS